jgi:type I restriction enzyme S subunit
MSRIPEGWRDVALGDICEFKYGKGLPKANRTAGKIPVFGSNGVVGYHEKAITNGPTIIIGRKGSFGEVNISLTPFWPIDTTYYIDSSATKEDLSWLAYRLPALGMTKLNRAAAIPGLNREDAYRQRLLLPPPAEQKRIAAILDKADAIRRKRQQAIQLTDDFLRAIFLDMFGDPVTNPKGWKCFPLGKLCRIRRGASPRPISKFLGGTIPWIKIGDGTKNSDIYIEDTKDKIIPEGVSKSVYLEPGSLIFANCGVSLGFARIMKMGGCIHDGWLSFDQFDKNLNEIYLLKTLNSVTNNFRQTAPDGTQPNLNTSIMKDFRLPLPPKTIQDKFSKIVMKFQYNKQKINRSKSLLEVLFNSLTQRAFRGEL